MTNVCFGRIDPFTTPSGNDCHLRGTAAHDVNRSLRIAADELAVGAIAAVRGREALSAHGGYFRWLPSLVHDVLHGQISAKDQEKLSVGGRQPVAFLHPCAVAHGIAVNRIGDEIVLRFGAHVVNRQTSRGAPLSRLQHDLLVASASCERRWPLADGNAETDPLCAALFRLPSARSRPRRFRAAGLLRRMEANRHVEGRADELQHMREVFVR